MVASHPHINRERLSELGAASRPEEGASSEFAAFNPESVLLPRPSPRVNRLARLGLDNPTMAYRGGSTLSWD